MQKVKLNNGKIIEVTANEAHTLIEAEEAVLYVKKTKPETKGKKYKTTSKRRYKNRMVTTEE